MQGKLRFPLVFLIIDSIAMVLLALGLYALFAQPDGALAMLAQPMLAWALIGLGAVMAVASTFGILSHLLNSKHPSA